mgnify:CR=1 FL=1
MMATIQEQKEHKEDGFTEPDQHNQYNKYP